MTAPPADCVFCAIIARTAPATIVREWPDALAIRPLTRENDGHLLVIPRAHVADAGVDPAVTARVTARAAELVAELPAANIITSKGSAATQTVFHLHLHVVPRYPRDGLALPWGWIKPTKEERVTIMKILRAILHVRTWACGNCGAQNPTTATRCGSCGAYF